MKTYENRTDYLIDRCGTAIEFCRNKQANTVYRTVKQNYEELIHIIQEIQEVMQKNREELVNSEKRIDDNKTVFYKRQFLKEFGSSKQFFKHFGLWKRVTLFVNNGEHQCTECLTKVELVNKNTVLFCPFFYKLESKLNNVEWIKIK